MKTRRTIAITCVCILLGIMLAVQNKSVNFNNSQNSVQNLRQEDLKDQLLLERQNNQELLKKIAEIEKNLEIFRSNDTSADNKVKALNQELIDTKIKAGLTDVTGKGVIITINSKSSNDVSEEGAQMIFKVLDIDLLNVINELKAAGAQAISINDERITAVTEIRGAGKFMVINGNQHVAPFVIKAISDPAKLESSLRILGGVIESLELYQHEVKLVRSDNIVINKLSDESILKIDLLKPVSN